MFFKINSERFKISSVSRYSDEGRSSQTKKWYVKIHFGSKERLFSFDTEDEKNAVLAYLDGSVFKVYII